MLSERIEELRSTILTLEKINTIIPQEIIEYRADESKSAIIRHAQAVKELFYKVSVNHISGEMIAGNNTTKYSPRPNHLTPQDMEEIRRYPDQVPGEVLTAMDEHIFYLWSFIQGHIIPDKDLVLRIGMNGVIRRIESRLRDGGLDEKQRDFLEAGLIESRAFLHYVARHSDYFHKLAQEASTDEDRRYYEELTRICKAVPANPASSFREALQSIWFTQIATQFDDVANHSLGRLDQYLFPYYKNDIEKGVIDRDAAGELFFEFWLKFNLGYKLQELSGTKMGLKVDDPETKELSVLKDESLDIYDSRNGFSWLALKCINKIHTDDGQTMDIAGTTQAGTDASNEISWLVLEAEDKLRTFEPKSVIKYTEKTDRRFMGKAYEILSSGFGLPAITFHQAGAKGLATYGLFSEEDIMNHSHIGCIELGIPGKSYTDPMNAFINLPKILLVALNNGQLSGKLIGMKSEEPDTWEGFLDCFYTQLDYFVRLYTEAMNAAAPFYAEYYARPLVSALVDGCISSAVPVDAGGATYWMKAVDCTGFATVVDSLFAVKKLVYEDGTITLERLRETLGGNFEGEEQFRLFVKNRIPKYGNGVKEVDKFARQVALKYAEIVKKYRTANGNSYRPGIYSFYEPIKTMGRVTGATPDGRKAGEVLSLNSAPYHGAIQNGLSDVLRSVTSIDHSMVDNASVVDVQLNGHTPPDVIKHIVEYLGKRDVLYVQFSAVEKEELMEAMKRPENYQDLVVRVTGFSARFVALPKDTQEEIVKRSYWN